jgi:hypothetical protein
MESGCLSGAQSKTPPVDSQHTGAACVSHAGQSQGSIASQRVGGARVFFFKISFQQ